MYACMQVSCICDTVLINPMARDEPRGEGAERQGQGSIRWQLVCLYKTAYG